MNSRFILSLMVLLGLSFLTNNRLSAQSCPALKTVDKAEIVGKWEGAYTYEDKTYDLKVEFTEEGEKLVAKMALPALNLKKKAFQTWICRAGEVHMRLDLEEGKAVKLIGYPENGVFSGRFVYNPVANVCGATKDKFTMRKTGKGIARASIN